MTKTPNSTWDPSVLRKYSSTGHFRLLNQVRSELRAQPLVRPGEGESVAEVNRSRALTRAIESRAGGGRSRRSAARVADVRPAQPPFDPMASLPPVDGGDDEAAASARSFRERLNAIDMR
ncbi:MAG: hypothetical protein VKO00_09600 [Cyanobacteriota bacterium]|nr:hypothetical protein [Cyanobacteriota bacterium]